MNLSGILAGSKGFNPHSFIGGLSAIAGIALFLVAGYVVINAMDVVAGRLGVPSIGWLGKLVALKYFISLVGAVPGAGGLAASSKFSLLVVELLLLYDIKNAVEKNAGLSGFSSATPRGSGYSQYYCCNQ